MPELISRMNLLRYFVFSIFLVIILLTINFYLERNSRCDLVKSKPNVISINTENLVEYTDNYKQAIELIKSCTSQLFYGGIYQPYSVYAVKILGNGHYLILFSLQFTEDAKIVFEFDENNKIVAKYVLGTS